MDYGKLAYLKTDELEAELAAIKRTSLDFHVGSVSVPAGIESTLLMKTADNAASAVIVGIAAKDGATGSAFLKIGNKRAARADFGANVREGTLIGAGGGDIALDTLQLDGGSVTCRVLSFGGKATGAPPSLRFAHNGDTYAVCSCAGGDVMLTLTDEKLKDRRTVKLGRGNRADVCAADVGFCVVYTDNFGTLWSLPLNTDGEIISRTCLGNEVGEVSVTCRGGRIYVFFAQDGRAHYFSAPLVGGSRGDTCDCGFSGRVQRTVAVKDSDPVAAVVESDGDVYLVREERQAAAETTFKIKLKGRAENV